MSTPPPPPPPPGQGPSDFPPSQSYHPQPLVPPGQAPPPPPPYGNQYPGQSPQQFPGQFPGQFPDQGYGAAPVQQKTNGLAIASFVLSLATIITWCIPITPVLGVIFGLVARRQLNHNPGQPGRGLATAGIIIGLVFIILIAAFWIWVATNGDCYRDGDTFRCRAFDN